MKKKTKANPKCKDCIAKENCDMEFGDVKCIAINITNCYNKSQRDFIEGLVSIAEEIFKKYYSKEIEEFHKKGHSVDLKPLSYEDN